MALPREIGRLVEGKEEVADEANGLADDDINAVNLLLDEIVVNIISHGYDDKLEHRILVDLALENDILSVRVEDDGRPFNPLEAPAPNLDETVRAAILGLSSPGTVPVLPGPEPVERDVSPRRASREWVEMTFGPLGSGRQEVRIGEETLTGRDLLDRMGLWGEDIDPIDVATIEEGGRWAVRYFDGEDRRVAVIEFSPRLDILSETRVHIREWMGDDYYGFDWPAGCPWAL